MKKFLICVSLGAAISGCDQLINTPVEVLPEPVVVADTLMPVVVLVPAGATTAEQFDTTTVAERKEVSNTTADVGGEKELGRTIASLGNPAQAGFWLETPLVKKVTDGRVVDAATGKDVLVELRPIDGPDGGGSRISLPAMRVLGAPLTGLPELTVYAR